MKRYHAHVYFEEDQVDQARELYQKIEQSFLLDEVNPYGFHAVKIGPHPLPMFEIHFDEESNIKATSWLIQNRRGFSVLIHEDTGDDVKDHSENIFWIGKPVIIDFEFFEKIKTNPELRIHPEKGTENEKTCTSLL